MKACMVENGMQFDEKEVSDLANALFEDAVQVRMCNIFIQFQIQNLYEKLQQSKYLNL